MCASLQRRDPKARRMMILGNFSLVAALLLWNFNRHNDSPAQLWLHAFCGLLFGISIGANLSGLLIARRCRARSL